MVNCPYCKELIGTDLDSCPFCYHTFTDRDREKMKEPEIELWNRKQEEVKLAYRQRVMLFIATAIGAGLLYLCFMLLMHFGLDDSVWMYILAVVAVVFIAVQTYLYYKLCRCPHCDRLIYRNGGDYCKWCGKNIR